jgi:phosphate transport system substrate-binding protein
VVLSRGVRVPAPFALLVLLAACGGHAARGRSELSRELERFRGLSGSLDIAGGTAHIPVMEEAAKRVMSAWPAIRITVAGGGSGVGVRKVGEGLVQIGNTGRPLSAEERETYGLVSHAFAIDGVAVVVHPANPVAALTTAQVRDLFAGRIVRWKDVGGPERAVHVYTRDEASGTREVFWSELLANGPVVESAVVMPSNGAMKTAVAGDESAVGYVSIGHVDATVRCPSLDGVTVTQEAAASGAYPVVRRLYMNTKPDPPALTRAFLDYVLGPEGAEIVRRAGYIPVPRGQ